MKTKGLLPIFKNFSYLAVGKIAGDIFTFLLFVSISRNFGQQGIGQYSFAMALTGFFGIIAEFGLYEYTVKELSRDKKLLNNDFFSILVLRFLLSMIIFLSLGASLWFTTYTTELRLIILIILLYQLAYVMLEGVGTVFLSNEDMNIVAIFELATKLLIACIGLLMIFFNSSLLLVVIVFPVITILNIVVAYWFLNYKYGSIARIFTLATSLSHARKSISYLLFALLNQLATRSDVILIGFILSISSVGIYNASFRIVFLFMMLSHFFGLALFPQLSKISIDSAARLKMLVNDSLNIIILIFLPAAGGIYLLSPQIVHLIYGPNFDGSILILQILSPLVFLTFPERILSFLLASSDKQVARVKTQGLIACLNLAANLVLIPTIGIAGSAIAAVLSYVLLILLYVIALSEHIDFPKMLLRLMISLFGTIFYIQFILLVGISSITLSIVFASFLYAIFVSLFKSVRNNELKYLLSKFHFL
jgi:O-antigen/teichoic acid export membrane protein